MGRNISVLKAKNYGAGKHKVNMDMNNLPSGTYYVKISIDKQEINKLVLKN
jgi:hypothetical protein